AQAGALIARRYRSRHRQTALRETREQAILGERAHPRLAAPEIAVLREPRHETAAPIVAQYPVARAALEEPRCTAAAAHGGEPIAIGPEFRLEHRLIDKGGRISQHGAPRSGNAYVHK